MNVINEIQDAIELLKDFFSKYENNELKTHKKRLKEALKLYKEYDISDNELLETQEFLIEKNNSEIYVSFLNTNY